MGKLTESEILFLKKYAGTLTEEERNTLNESYSIEYDDETGLHNVYKLRSGVLSGQPKKSFIDAFETEQHALAAFPSARVFTFNRAQSSSKK